MTGGATGTGKHFLGVAVQALTSSISFKAINICSGFLLSRTFLYLINP